MLRLICDRYKLLKPLYSDNQKDIFTYLAEDTVFPGRKCIVKTTDRFRLEPAKLEEIKQILTNPKFPRDINCCQLIDFQKVNDIYCLIFNYIEGESLDKLIRSGNLSDSITVQSLVIQLLEILRRLHEVGLVHNDLKPANIILSAEDKQFYLIDFEAICRIKEGNKNRSIVYTEGYASAEQKRGYISVQNDLYALGMTALEVLQDQRIYSFKREANGEIALPPNLAITPQLEEVLLRLTHKDSKQRYDSCEQVLADLKGTKSTVRVAPAASPEDFQQDIPYYESIEAKSAFNTKVWKALYWIFAISVAPLIVTFIITEKLLARHDQNSPVNKQNPELHQQPDSQPTSPKQDFPDREDRQPILEPEDSPNFSTKPVTPSNLPVIKSQEEPIFTDEVQNSGDSAPENLPPRHWFQKGK